MSNPTWARAARLLVSLALLAAVPVLAGCQQSMATRAAPTAGELFGVAIEPIPAPVTLRYGPVAGATFSSSVGVLAALNGQRVSERDALGGTLSITPAGGGLMRMAANFQSVRAELTEELDVGPFRVDLLITDQGVVRDVAFAFSGGRVPSVTRMRKLGDMMNTLFPVFRWPTAPIAQGESFNALTVSLDGPVGPDTGSASMPLKLDGQAMRNGRLVYLVGYEGAAPFNGDLTSFSGYYLVDAQTGVIVERRFAARGKDYFYGEVVLIDYDIETRISI